MQVMLLGFGSAFLHILCTEGRGAGLCWAHSQPKGPKGWLGGFGLRLQKLGLMTRAVEVYTVLNGRGGGGIIPGASVDASTGNVWTGCAQLGSDASGPSGPLGSSSSQHRRTLELILQAPRTPGLNTMKHSRTYDRTPHPSPDPQDIQVLEPEITLLIPGCVNP